MVKDNNSKDININEALKDFQEAIKNIEKTVANLQNTEKNMALTKDKLNQVRKTTSEGTSIFQKTHENKVAQRSNFKHSESLSSNRRLLSMMVLGNHTFEEKANQINDEFLTLLVESDSDEDLIIFQTANNKKI